jgi:hypothetical protein
MSNSNTANGKTRPSTAELEKRRLEKQLASAKGQMFSLSHEVKPYTVKKDPKIGEYIILAMGGSSQSDYVQQVILHRLIGSDYTIDSEQDWVMSNASDIPGFFASEKFPGEKKCLEKLGKYRTSKALAKKKIKISELGKEVYPISGKNREETLNLARTASAIHAKVPKSNHFGEWILYMDPADLREEIAYQEAIHAHADADLKDVEGILKDLIYYQTALIDGRLQKRVPHLRGVSAVGVVPLLYKLMATGYYPESPGSYGLIQTRHVPFKVFTDYKSGEASSFAKLHSALEAYKDALKAVNSIKSDIAKTKDKQALSAKEKDLEYQTRWLDDAANEVLQAEDVKDYPTIKVEKKVEVTTAHQPSGIGGDATPSKAATSK